MPRDKKAAAIIDRAADNREATYNAEKDTRDKMLEDLRFSNLDQWPAEVKKARKNRVMLTLDRIGQVERSILGDMRQNRPSLRFSPADENTDPETAELITGLVRRIERDNAAIEAYMCAATSQVRNGYGVFRIGTEFASHDVFEQNITIDSIKNPLNWYFDHRASHLTKHDGKFALGIERMPIEEFERKHPELKKADFQAVTKSGESNQFWYQDNDVIIAEYWEKVPKKTTLALLSDGRTLSIDKLTSKDEEFLASQGIRITRKRNVDSFDIKWYKLTGVDILETKEWPSKYFGAILVCGEEHNIEGHIDYRGIVRPAKDGQRMFNYWNSAASEAVALQPKAPWLVTTKMIKALKRYWNRANDDNLPYLQYTHDPDAPQGPQRQSPPTLQAGLLQQAQVAAESIQAATGRYDAALGAPSTEVSGDAISARTANSEIGSSVYMHNLALAIEQGGRVIVDLIPTIYDTQRVIRVLGPDDTEKMELINNPMITQDGLRIKNDLTRGKYDVSTSVGPSYKTKRDHAFDSLVQLAGIIPQIPEKAPDLIVKSLDAPGMDEVADRIKPAGVTDDDSPEAQAQIQAARQEQQRQQQIEEQLLSQQFRQNEADINETKADALKKLTEAQENQLENAEKAQQIEVRDQAQRVVRALTGI